MRTVVALTALALMIGCSTAPRVRQAAIDDTMKLQPGTYRLILLGGANSMDAERIAVLDLEGDALAITPREIADKYKITEGLAGAEAIERGKAFLSGNCAYAGYTIRALMAPDGVGLGYEMVPYYGAGGCGSGGTVLSDYFIKDGKVVMYVRMMMPDRDTTVEILKP